MFKRSKIYKYLAFSFILSSLFGVVIYSQLSNRHKAIVKTLALHKTGLVDNDWLINNSKKEYKMLSPTFIIDGIYKSMEGPKASRYIQLDQSDKILWITGFKVKAVDAKTNEALSNDYICHMNVDINDTQYYTQWHLEDRIGKQYPRMTSLSHGLEHFDFPKGYGVPIIGKDYLFVTTQTLNHNQPDIFKKVKHEVSVRYEAYDKTQKPLMSKTVYIQLPFDKHDPFKGPLDPASNQCIPVETKNHTYCDKAGNMLSGHWVIPSGIKTYRSSITEQLQIKDSARLHFSAPHVHPFATSISVVDKTENKMLFTCKVTNYTTKIGLQNIETFSSKNGIWLYENHEYELVMTCNNTSKTDQDMMGSMFLFFYDKELDRTISKL
ncbi:hypothetical protein IP98_00512 [Flavobacterium cauense R2A-7]|uniref:Uncharacterized protein n=1 Tax=Flavobacterium cauense R2A-7 TaxID=1341154 RepID=A0A562M3P7_9FLAO|nr:hypothetical protein [Flavobacterium cauense]KGO84099.1 hypothetical protein Q762_02370 [Flavobacterium cauense R2A-7]TWI14555.1 hypothetical protein IP98_00512 [Flavobacterium cauense R2A-7]